MFIIIFKDLSIYDFHISFSYFPQLNCYLITENE